MNDLATKLVFENAGSFVDPEIILGVYTFIVVGSLFGIYVLRVKVQGVKNGESISPQPRDRFIFFSFIIAYSLIGIIGIIDLFTLRYPPEKVLCFNVNYRNNPKTRIGYLNDTRRFVNLSDLPSGNISFFEPNSFTLKDYQACNNEELDFIKEVDSARIKVYQDSNSIKH
jgi:hypothetical protein